MMTNYNLALGTARSLGYFSQSEEERFRPSIRTALQHAPAWASLLVSTDSPEYQDYQRRLRRVARGFRTNTIGTAQRNPDRRASRAAAMKGNYRGNRRNQ